jgi:hypothetical protein
MLAVLAAMGFAVTTLAAASPACAEAPASVVAEASHDDCEPHDAPATLPDGHDTCAMVAPCTSPVVVTPTAGVLVAALRDDRPVSGSAVRTDTAVPAPASPPPRA